MDDVSWVGRFALVLRTWTLPQAIGYEQAMRFLLENRTVDADEALRLGFVGEVVDDERLEARLAEYCAPPPSQHPDAHNERHAEESQAESVHFWCLLPSAGSHTSPRPVTRG